MKKFVLLALLPVLFIPCAAQTWQRATEQDCRAIANDSDAPHYKLTMAANDGTLFGMQTCGFIDGKGGVKPLYWLDVCQITEDDFKILARKDKDGDNKTRLMAESCRSGDIPKVAVEREEK